MTVNHGVLSSSLRRSANPKRCDFNRISFFVVDGMISVYAPNFLLRCKVSIFDFISKYGEKVGTFKIYGKIKSIRNA